MKAADRMLCRDLAAVPLAVRSLATLTKYQGLPDLRRLGRPREVEIFANGEEVPDLVHLQYDPPHGLIGATDAGTTGRRCPSSDYRRSACCGDCFWLWNRGALGISNPSWPDRP
jgi:hypothetical protein